MDDTPISSGEGLPAFVGLARASTVAQAYEVSPSAVGRRLRTFPALAAGYGRGCQVRVADFVAAARWWHGWELHHPALLTPRPNEVPKVTERLRVTVQRKSRLGGSATVSLNGVTLHNLLWHTQAGEVVIQPPHYAGHSVPAFELAPQLAERIRASIARKAQKDAAA